MPDIQSSQAISPNEKPEPRWIPAEQIVALNKRIVDQTGEDHIILQNNLVESAAARPRNMFFYEGETDIVRLAVRLIEAVGKNHCFGQGNKRTAFHAGIAFMVANGFDPQIADTEQAAQVVEQVIIGQAPAVDLERLFRGMT